MKKFVHWIEVECESGVKSEVKQFDEVLGYVKEYPNTNIDVYVFNRATFSIVLRVECSQNYDNLDMKVNSGFNSLVRRSRKPRGLRYLKNFGEYVLGLEYLYDELRDDFKEIANSYVEKELDKLGYCKRCELEKTRRELEDIDGYPYCSNCAEIEVALMEEKDNTERRVEELFKKKNWTQFLKNEDNYVWQDVVRLSIEDNISVERFIKRSFSELDNNEIKDLVEFIDRNLVKTI